MSGQKRLDLSKEQKKVKPLIEDVIPHYLDGENMKNALELIAYLRENKMKPVWTGTNAWKAIYDNKVIFYIRLYNDWDKTEHLKEKYGKHSWVVTLYIEDNMNKYEDIILNEGLQIFIWENAHYCMICRSPCHGKNPPHKDVIVLGKEINRICHGRPLT